MLLVEQSVRESDASQLARLTEVLSCPARTCRPAAGAGLVNGRSDATHLLDCPVSLSCGNSFCRRCLPVDLHPGTVCRFQCPPARGGRRCNSIVPCQATHAVVDPKVDVCLAKVVAAYQKVLEEASRRKATEHQRQLGSREPDTTVDGDDDDSDADDRHDRQTDWSSKQRASLHVSIEALKNAILPELECQICLLAPMVEPVTSSCGHTFCRKCIIRVLDHSDTCPLCRHKLSVVQYHYNRPVNQKIDFLSRYLSPEMYEEVAEIAKREPIPPSIRDDLVETPIFVCSLAFPGLRCFLHIFEPKYRLMLRRCLESERDPVFGMVLPAEDGSDAYSEYGTLLRIRHTEQLMDGRSLVDTIGTRRFRVVRRHVVDGYNVAQVKLFDDDWDESELAEIDEAMNSIEHHVAGSSVIVPAPSVPAQSDTGANEIRDAARSSPSAEAGSRSRPRLHARVNPDLQQSSRQSSPLALLGGDQSDENQSSPTDHDDEEESDRSESEDSTDDRQEFENISITASVSLCSHFVATLRENMSPRVFERILCQYGPAPLDPSLFSFWVAAVLPIEDNRKSVLLQVRSVKKRFRLLLSWMDELKSQWWWSRGACAVS